MIALELGENRHLLQHEVATLRACASLRCSFTVPFSTAQSAPHSSTAQLSDLSPSSKGLFVLQVL